MVGYLMGGRFFQEDAAEIDVQVFKDAFVIIIRTRTRTDRVNRLQPQIIPQPEIGFVQEHGSVPHHIHGHPIRLLVVQRHDDPLSVR